MNREEKENQCLSDDEDDEEEFVFSGKRKYDVVTTKREKRNKHNCSERKRRFVIRDAFTILGGRIPSVRQGAQQGRAKASRAQILKKAADYITSLRATQENYKKRIEDIREANANIENEIRELENGSTSSNGILGIKNSSSIQIKTEGRFVISPHGINSLMSTLTPQVISPSVPQSFINFENHFEVSKFIKSEDPHSVPLYSNATQSSSVPSCSNVTPSLSVPSPSSFLQSEIPVSTHSFFKYEPVNVKEEPLDESSYESSSDDDSDCDYFLGPNRFKIN